MNTFTRTALLLLCLSFTAPLSASLDDFDYYGKDLTAIQRSTNDELKEALYKAISNQRVFNYKTARRYLFGELYLHSNNGEYEVVDSYCEESFGSSVGVGPNRIPNHQTLNCEHTWPQSRFNYRQNSRAQKADLHHLFPSKSQANSTRGNSEFAEVNGDFLPYCYASKRGPAINSGIEAFEPPDNHKGNVARALFYFSVRYKMRISAREEVYLRSWHRLDPADKQEVERNQRIFEIQGNRNPFIDEADLVDQIKDF